MTPKEKAEDLVNKYTFKNVIKIVRINYNHPKQCALIAVDEIISAIDFVCMDGKIWNTNLKYWNEVKQEIEKL